jgi:WG containing repeat
MERFEDDVLSMKLGRSRRGRSSGVIVPCCAVIALLVGCGNDSVASQSNVETSVETSVDPDVPLCGSEVEDSSPGNFDRFSFSVETDTSTRFGFKNKNGDVVIKPQFGFAYEFGEGGIAAVANPPANDEVGVRFSFIDPSGKEIAQAYPFDNGPDYFQDGFARIINDAKLVGFIDRQGKVVIAPTFVGAESFCNGRALVNDGSVKWEVDTAGVALGKKTPFIADPEELG